MFRKAAWIAGLLVLGGAPASADNFVPAPHMRDMVLDLDTQTGNFSVWRITDLSNINAVRMTIKVHRLGDHPRWAPAFGITFRGGERSVAFQLISPTRSPPLIMALFSGSYNSQSPHEDFTKTIGLDEKVDVAVDWTSDGAITVKTGSEAHSISLGAPVGSIEFTGSTGEAEFNPLGVGTTTP